MVHFSPEFCRIMGFLSDDSSDESEEESAIFPTQSQSQTQTDRSSGTDPLSDSTSSSEDEALADILAELNVTVEYAEGERPCKHANCTVPTTRKFCLFHSTQRCSEEGCDRAAWISGRCRRHNNYVPPKCSFEGCDNQAKIKGKCHRHGAPIKLCKFSGKFFLEDRRSSIYIFLQSKILKSPQAVQSEPSSKAYVTPITPTRDSVSNVRSIL